MPHCMRQLQFAWELSPEDAKSIRAVQAGNNAAFDDLLSRHRGLIGHVLRQYRIDPLEREEAETAALYGLWQAAKRYDFSRPCTFSTVACIWIRQAVSRYFWKPANQRNLLMASLDCDIESDLDLADLVTDHREPLPERAIEESPQMELAALLQDAQRRRLITQREAVVLELRGKGYILDAIAARIGCTRQRVQQMEEKAITRIRNKTKLDYWVDRGV